MEKKYHSHIFLGQTTCNDRHIHKYAGVSSKSQSGVPHTHVIEGDTTFNDGHEHHYKINTGPAIMLPDGHHNHFYEAQTDYADGHAHFVYGYTSID